MEEKLIVWECESSTDDMNILVPGYPEAFLGVEPDPYSDYKFIMRVLLNTGNPDHLITFKIISNEPLVFDHARLTLKESYLGTMIREERRVYIFVDGIKPCKEGV